MSNYVRKFKIVYDGGDSATYIENIYCKYEGVWGGEMWANEDGTPVSFKCLCENHSQVMAMCIAGIPTEDEFFYWDEIKEFDIPKAVAKTFNWAYPQKIKNHW